MFGRGWEVGDIGDIVIRKMHINIQNKVSGLNVKHDSYT